VGGTGSGGIESGGIESGGIESGGIESGGIESGGIESGGIESGGIESGGIESGGIESGGIESGGIESVGIESGGIESVDTVSPGGITFLSGVIPYQTTPAISKKMPTMSARSNPVLRWGWMGAYPEMSGPSGARDSETAASDVCVAVRSSEPQCGQDLLGHAPKLEPQDVQYML
jgi:hypothetical protein